jgi:CheY-like chemotaxis protein
MDGITATRIIRERERADGAEHVPIVALTAGATVEDRENSLAAGMNDFITKPFRAGELFAVVESVAAFGLEAQAPVNVEGAMLTKASEACLDRDSALRNLEGDEEFLNELSEMFLQQCPDLLSAVEQAVSSNSADELQRAAHALKGSSLVIGGQATAASALALEQLGRDGSLVEAAPVLHGLQGNLAELRVALLGALGKQEA